MTERGILRPLRWCIGGAVCLVVLSCATTPDNPLRSLKTSPDAPRPDQGMALRAGTNLASLESGYQVFHRKCLDCHEPRIPNNPGHRDWHPVLTGMSWNAELSESESQDMMAYLRAVAE